MLGHLVDMLDLVIQRRSSDSSQMLLYYLVQNKSPVVFVIFHPNGEENPRKTGDR